MAPAGNKGLGERDLIISQILPVEPGAKQMLFADNCYDSTVPWNWSSLKNPLSHTYLNLIGYKILSLLGAIFHNTYIIEPVTV